MTDNDFNEYHARRVLSEEIQSQREFAIDILEKIKEEINNGYPTSVEDIIWIIDNEISEMKGE